jgi:hypothetical protein
VSVKPRRERHAAGMGLTAFLSNGGPSDTGCGRGRTTRHRPTACQNATRSSTAA